MDTAARLQGAVQSITGLFSRKTKDIAPPRLCQPVRYPFGEFEFHMHSPAGDEVELEVSRDFRHWERLDNITPAKDASVVSDKKAGTYPVLFYRARLAELCSNYLGFISFEIPPGYSMVANPLRAASNQIASLFPAVPEGCTLTKFSLVTFALTKNTFSNGAWSSPADTLSAGEGALFFNAGESSIFARFVGEVPQDLQSLTVRTGTSMRGSLLPLSGRLDMDLGFPISAGDVVSIYSNSHERYFEMKYTDKGWAGEAPVLRVGEAFWVSKNTAKVWTQQLPGG